MINTLLLISILSMIFAAAAMVLVRIARPSFGYSWLIAAFGASVAWLLLLPVGGNLPIQLTLAVWEPTELLSASLGFLVDHISWSYGLALAGLVLAVIFTDVLRAVEADWSAWAGSLTLGALGLVAVFAGNPVTLMMAWAAIDSAEMLILLWHIKPSAIREKVIASFSSRVGGIFLVLIGEIFTQASGQVLDFTTINDTARIYLVLACGLRLGVVPLHIPFLQEPPLRRSLGTTIRLVPVASSLVLLTRTASAASPPLSWGLLTTLSVFAALFGAFSWALAKDELDGRPYWIIGVVSVALFSALRGEEIVSLSWGIAALLTGGLLFISSARHRYLLPLTGLGLIGILPVPFTPGWAGFGLYSPPYSLSLGVILVSQSLLVIGYLSHLLRSGPSLAGIERWVWGIYPIGLVVLLISYSVITSRGLIDGIQPVGAQLASRLVAGGLFIAFCMIWVYISRRGFGVPGGILLMIRKALSLGWMYRFLWSMFHYFRRSVATLTFVLEGQGGILWTLLLVILILAFLTQRG